MAVPLLVCTKEKQRLCHICLRAGVQSAEIIMFMCAVWEQCSLSEKCMCMGAGI